MFIEAEYEDNGETCEVYAHIVDLNAFIHAGDESLIFVSDVEGNQWSQRKGDLIFKSIITKD